MYRSWLSRTRLGLWVGALAVLISACAGSSFDREDAIAALETTGATEPEATCVADTLLLVDALDAADPRQTRDAADREALVTAMGRCVDQTIETEVAGAVESPGLEAELFDPEGLDISEDLLASEGLDPFSGQPLDPDQLESLREEGVAILTALGRSPLNAGCIVDNLIDSDASFVILTREFGLGLDPLEANAIASCIGVR